MVLRRHLQELGTHYQELLDDSVVQIGIVSPEGTLIYSTAGGPPVNLSDREHIRVHLDAQHLDRLFVSRPVMGRASGKWSIQLSRPIFDHGKFVGVIVVSVDPGYFVRFYQKINLGERGLVLILRETGEILARSPDLEKHIGKKLVSAPPSGPNHPLKGNFHVSSSIDGAERVVGYVRMPRYGISVIVGAGVDEQMASVHTHQRLMLTIAGAATLLFSLPSFQIKQTVFHHKIKEFSCLFGKFMIHGSRLFQKFFFRSLRNCISIRIGKTFVIIF